MNPKVSFSCLLLLFFFATAVGCNAYQTAFYVNDVNRARNMLKEERDEVKQALQKKITPEKIVRLVELGLLQKAEHYLDKADTSGNAIKLVQAKLYVKQHQYFKAEKKVEAVLADDPENRQAQQLRAALFIQSWELDKADKIAKQILEQKETDVKAGWIRGRVALFQRKYDKALEWAQKMQEWNPERAEGYLLEAQYYFWMQNHTKAQAPLIKVLEVEPFNADARYFYGYAIWRRVDATQLDEMAAQWNFALEINPLHYLTHWHFGNGYTNLTYADYATSSDSIVRSRLAEADEMVAQGQLDKAIATTHEIGSEFSKSVLPAMMRGSVYYMHYSMDRQTRLDSAAVIFRSILKRKQNYGPAHNGLAAVIKQRQFRYLEGFEKLEAAIRNTKLPKNEVFYKVFPDLKYYPGKRVGKMVTQQLGPSRVYLPMINTFGSNFQIPPLHHDLAMAMDSPYFRYATTFDNRQWMDIRGVGSGATGIEYIERGSHWERNVLAHEYSHLYHGRILTYKESRRIRALYYAAMVNDRTLDYYSANNESEFFAQAYAAYLSQKKVHPLTHKSMNTRAYLRKKDLALYAFIDSLIQKQKAYLAGNKKVMKSNWAQTYLTLTEQHNEKPKLAKAYLDTALSYDKFYLPALLAYARIEAKTGHFNEARNWIAKAVSVDSTFAPVYVTKAYLLHERALQGKIDFKTSFEKQIPLVEKALNLEQDFAARAQINRTYRWRSLQYGNIAKAIEVAEQYLQDPPTVSTYLRDRKEEAAVFVKSLYSQIGYSQKVISFFEDLVQQNPQNFYYRLKYADVLIEARKWNEALQILQEGQQILTAANDRRASYSLRIAKTLLQKGDATAARKQIATVDKSSLSFNQKLLLTQIYLKMDQTEKAEDLQPSKSKAKVPVEKTRWAYVQGLIQKQKNHNKAAIRSFRTALKWNPYHLPARVSLIHLFQSIGEKKKAQKIKQQTASLAIPLGPGFQRMTDLNFNH